MPLLVQDIMIIGVKYINFSERASKPRARQGSVEVRSMKYTEIDDPGVRFWDSECRTTQLYEVHKAKQTAQRARMIQTRTNWRSIDNTFELSKTCPCESHSSYTLYLSTVPSSIIKNLATHYPINSSLSSTSQFPFGCFIWQHNHLPHDTESCHASHCDPRIWEEDCTAEIYYSRNNPIQYREVTNHCLYIIEKTLSQFRIT